MSKLAGNVLEFDGLLGVSGVPGVLGMPDVFTVPGVPDLPGTVILRFTQVKEVYLYNITIEGD